MVRRRHSKTPCPHDSVFLAIGIVITLSIAVLLIENNPTLIQGYASLGHDSVTGNLVTDNGHDAQTTPKNDNQPHCGDGTIRGNEECDDGNTNSGDGCDVNCRKEAPQPAATTPAVTDPVTPAVTQPVQPPVASAPVMPSTGTQPVMPSTGTQPVQPNLGTQPVNAPVMPSTGQNAMPTAPQTTAPASQQNLNNDDNAQFQSAPILPQQPASAQPQVVSGQVSQSGQTTQVQVTLVQPAPVAPQATTTVTVSTAAPRFEQPISRQFETREGTHVGVNVTTGTTLTQVNVVVPQEKATVEVQELSTPPADMPFNKPAYRAFQATVPDAEPEAALFKFKVEKQWVAAQGISANDVALYRYTWQWNEILAVLISEDGTYFYYEAQSPGLSYFVVSIKSTPTGKIVVTQGQAGPSEPVLPGNAEIVPAAERGENPVLEVPAQAPLQNESSGATTGLLTLAILVIVAGGAFAMFRRPTSVTETISSPDIESALDAFEDAVISGDKSKAQRQLSAAERALDDADSKVRAAYSNKVQEAFTRLRGM
jgi:PGF-pre-PGF domain-containing protein